MVYTSLFLNWMKNSNHYKFFLSWTSIQQAFDLELQHMYEVNNAIAGILFNAWFMPVMYILKSPQIYIVPLIFFIFDIYSPFKHLPFLNIMF